MKNIYFIIGIIGIEMVPSAIGLTINANSSRESIDNDRAKLP